GELVTRTAREGGGEIVPIDSEHSAVLQCVTGRRPAELARLILTASGGPFRTWTPERVAGATVDEALRHPTWKMGKKITVDSATLDAVRIDRKSTRLNSSHRTISYAVFCL